MLGSLVQRVFRTPVDGVGAGGDGAHLVEPEIVALEDALHLFPDGADLAYGRMRVRAFLRIRIDRSAPAN